MDLTIRFRFNKLTGEIEEFQVDAARDDRSNADHNAEHERLAAEIGRVVDGHPRLIEVAPGGHGSAPDAKPMTEEPDAHRTTSGPMTQSS
jgi:hypothetical protein